MTQSVPSDQELERLKIERVHELAMYQAKTERQRAHTEHFKAVTYRLCIIGRFLLGLTALSSGYVTGATSVAKAWLVAWVGDADVTHSSDSPVQHRTPLSHDTVPLQQPSPPVEMASDDAS